MKELLETGERLKHYSRNLNFWIGDWLWEFPDGEENYNDWLDYALITEYKKIAKMFPASLRGLSWSSYRVLSKIKDSVEREAICKYALKNKLHSKDIKILIDNNKDL